MQNVCLRPLLAAFAVAASLCVGASSRAVAEPFPPITDAERALTAVPGAPNAPAVVLARNAELLMMGYGKESRGISSRLAVQVRTKILTKEGVESSGEVSIPHSDYARLQGFEGRTVLPDGTVVPVPADARFRRKVSDVRKAFVTSVAFPAVQPGAILEYRYELLFDSIYYLEPWYFADEVPVLHSEITYKIPKVVRAKKWSRDPFQVGLHEESKDSTRGTELRVWADDVPRVQLDPYGLPFSDLALQMVVLPAIFDDPLVREKLLDSWQSISEMTFEIYDQAQRKDGGVGKKAREIAGGVQGGAREKAQALYRFVRDEIATKDQEGIFLAEGASVGKTLSEKSGDYADKALLLQSLLKEAKISSRLLWAADRRRGQVDPGLTNPLWFDRVLVAADLDGQRVFLDPADRDLGFGQLQPWYEATPALIPDKKKPEGIVLPETPFDQSARKAVLDLSLDAAGRLAGSGEMVLTGHHAWEKIHWKEDAAKTAEAWKDSLAEDFKEFKIADVKVEESPDDRRVRVTWTMQQREDEVLGDESTLVPSRPLGPSTQPFVQAADKRRSPVLFSYADRDEVELRLRWPEGWKLDQTPKLAKQDNALGGFTVSLDSDDAARTLVYRRRLEIKQKQLASMQQYESVRSLYAAVEKSDAQTVSLVRH
jgi:hypothetical protein